jgi:hypothetical protein
MIIMMLEIELIKQLYHTCECSLHRQFMVINGDH